MSHAILFGFLVLAFWLIKRDVASRPGLSRAIWIPTLWVAVISSRNVSAWLGIKGATDTLEGSPVDRYYFLALIAASLVVLSRRRFRWGTFAARNWPVMLFYGFLLVSVLWANSPTASFKRWIKEAGNIAVVLVILTETHPLQAIRAVFVRCAYVLIPLSLIFIRYFPALGRTYNRHSGGMEATGVTFQKNSLGAMLLVCGFVFLWDVFESRRSGSHVSRWRSYVVTPSMLAIMAWLLVLSDSKTSIVALLVATAILMAAHAPALRQKIRSFGLYAVLGAAASFALDQVFGLSQSIVHALGRNMTFTGRTDVWRELLNLHTDPVLGTGFMSLWDDPHYRDILPNWVAFSAHNGYLEVYLAGGAIGLSLLILMLAITGLRIHRDLGSDAGAVVRFAMFVAVLIANTMESNFACMTPVGFMFLMAACGTRRGLQATAPQSVKSPADESPALPVFQFRR